MKAQKHERALCAPTFKITVVVSFLGWVGSTHADHGPTVFFRHVAQTDMPAPGTEPGVVFGDLTTQISHDLLVPKIDESGRVAFTAILSGPDVDVTNFQSIWAERNGQLHLVARGGMPAPGTEEGILFIGVPSLEVPFAPEFAGGQTAFHGELIGSGLDITNDQGFWAGPPGNLRLVAREGGPAPGLAGLTLGISIGIINQAGHVVLHTDLRGAGVDATNRSCLYTDRSGALQLLVREGDPAPFTESGTVFGGNIPFPAFSFNANSNFALSAKVEGPAVDSSNDQLLYVERDGVLELVLREGDPAPGAGPNVTFGSGSSNLSLNFVAMNNQNRVAFLLRLGGAVATQTAIFSNHTGSLTAVAVPDQPAPGTNFDYTFFATPMLNDANRIVFGVAFPHDGGIFTPSPFGVFSDIDGSIAPIVSPGDTTLEGEIIENARPSAFNAAGQLLLSMRVESPTTRNGFWLRDTDGALHRIAATGDQFDLTGDGTDVRDVIRVVTGGMNEAGQVAVRLDFADDSSAHFVASLCTEGVVGGDANGDCHLDLTDFVQFPSCLSGPGASTAPSQPCPLFDLDRDNDVDLNDFARLQSLITGP